MKYRIFGRKTIEVLREHERWVAYYLGNEGKKRRANDLILPTSLKAGEIEAYLADVFHEWASTIHNNIEKLRIIRALEGNVVALASVFFYFQELGRVNCNKVR